MEKEELLKLKKGTLLVLTNDTPGDNMVGQIFLFDHLNEKGNIIFIAYYNPATDELILNPSGKIHMGKGNGVRLATMTEELIFERVATNYGYSWDADKEELISHAKLGFPHVDADGFGVLLIRDLSPQQKYVIKELLKSWTDAKP